MQSLHQDARYQEFWACLALRNTERLGPKTGKALIQAYGSARAAVADACNWSAQPTVRPSLANIFLQEKWREPALQEWRRAGKHAHDVLLFTDPDYPEHLRQIPDPPLYLYLAGDRRLLQQPCIAMVGSRMCSGYGQTMARNLATGLSQAGMCIVSGFASGIDRQAHLAGLEYPGRSIAVLGTGLDLIYPSRNRDLWDQLLANGLILTEFPPGVEPEAHNFPRRNRIISGLSLGVIVVEAAQRSGSLITSRLALDYNREVFAVPGQVTSPSFAGCLDLLRQGAVLTRSAEDVLDELHIHVRPEPEPFRETDRDAGRKQPEDRFQDLNQDEQALVALLLPEPKLHIDTLTQHLGWESQRVSQTLLMLELKGVVRQHSGMYYALA